MPPKRDFLRRGEKTRQVYDPLQSIKQEKLQRASNEPSRLTSLAVGKTGSTCPPLIARGPLERQASPSGGEQPGVHSNALVKTRRDESQARSCPRTPQAHRAHVQKIAAMKRDYESPYKQAPRAEQAADEETLNISQVDARTSQCESSHTQARQAKNFLQRNRAKVHGPTDSMRAPLPGSRQRERVESEQHSPQKATAYLQRECLEE